MILPLALLLLVCNNVSPQTTIHYSDMTKEQKLIQAAKDGNIYGIKESIAERVDINLKSRDYGMTALHYVANGGYVNCAVELIVNGGADMDIKDDSGQTALMLAATRMASVEVGKVLINKGANVELKDDNGMTALMWATTHRNEKIVRSLLQNQARTDVIASKFYSQFLMKVI
jgi:ankyrin repeat protein